MSKGEKNEMRRLIFLVLLFFLAALGAWGIYSQRPFSRRLSAFVTDLRGRSEAQRENILRAGRSISGIVVASGQVFSLNRWAGPYTLERGFLPERSFRGKEVILTPGGGVCQLASTLYNAAQLAGLEILERIPHSQPVRSVPPGQDAALAFGVADLKFRNHYPYPIKILSRPVRDHLLIEIWGEEERHGRTEL